MILMLLPFLTILNKGTSITTSPPSLANSQSQQARSDCTELPLDNLDMQRSNSAGFLRQVLDINASRCGDRRSGLTLGLRIPATSRSS